MPDARILRQIVASLRGLVFKARDAGSPVSADVLTMAAGAVQDAASAEDKERAHEPEHTVYQLRRDRP